MTSLAKSEMKQVQNLNRFDFFGRMATVLRNAPEARQSHKSPTLEPFYANGLLKLLQILADKSAENASAAHVWRGFLAKNGHPLCPLGLVGDLSRGRAILCPDRSCPTFLARDFF